jgi:hypothetical protein
MVALKAIRQLGPGPLALYALYRLGLMTGHYERGEKERGKKEEGGRYGNLLSPFVWRYEAQV